MLAEAVAGELGQAFHDNLCEGSVMAFRGGRGGKIFKTREREAGLRNGFVCWVM